MNKEVIICVGISGSGKSTWSANFIKNNSNYLRINRDDIRKTLVGNLNGYYQRADFNRLECHINGIESNMYDFIIGLDKSIIIDNTNLKKLYIDKWINYVEYHNGSRLDEEHVNFKFKLFDIGLEEAKDRVYDRENMYQWGELLDKNKELAYIDKQFEQYQNIKKWLNDNYKDKII